VRASLASSRQKDTKKSARFHTQNFTRFAFGKDLKGPAAHFAVGSKALLGNARVDHDFESLPAKRTLDEFGDFHAASAWNIGWNK
jgi:hypothetical protein